MNRLSGIDNAGELLARADRSVSSAFEFRADIQLLRALAIILVLADHLRVPYIQGGFLGVDLFFVVSGFLMTRIIVRGLRDGTFKYLTFLKRRARRLLPASIFTMLLTAIAAPFILDHNAYRDFVLQLFGGMTFTSNVILWRQSDYFSAAAELKPLLHLWSLSLEEQFYFLVPLVLMAAGVRWTRSVLSILVVGSLLACLVLRPISPSAVFYLLPTRAWELGFGSLVGMLVEQGAISRRSMPITRAFAALLLVAIPLLVNANGHPGVAAIIICAATAVLMVPGWHAPKAHRWLLPFQAIGDRSYSLYLVHWPILAFANNIWIEAVPGSIKILLTASIIILTEVQYRFVEQKLRHVAIARSHIMALAGLTAFLVVYSGLALVIQKDTFSKDLKYNDGLGYNCAPSLGGDDFPCVTRPNPRLVLWGDSFAMALSDGIAASTDVGIAQITKPLCGPFIDLAPTNDTMYSEQWARACLDRNQAAVKSLRMHDGVDVVVLGSSMAQYVAGMGEGYRAMISRGGRYQVVDASDAEVIRSFTRTVAAIRAAGKRVAFVAPPPSAGFDAARCVAREAQDKITAAPGGSCDFTVEQYRKFRSPVRRVIQEMARQANVPVVTLDDSICDASARCSVIKNGILMYSDGVHLSRDGSRFVGQSTKLGATLMTVAR